MNDLISVIVPVYNVEQYLPQCIESILGQTHKNLEIILVDDGSVDNCGKICDDYMHLDNRIQVIHKENAGVGFARNTGLEAACGEYIMFVDSDDAITPDAVQVLYDRLIADGSDVALGKHIDTYTDGSTDDTSAKWMKDVVLSADMLLEQMDGRCNVPVAVWAKLYRRGVLQGIAYPNLKCAEDLWVFPDIINRCRKISIVDKTLYHYYQRSNSLMHAKSEIAKRDELDATLHMVEYLLAKGIMKSARYWYQRGISRALEFADRAVALELFAQYFDRRENKMLLVGSSIKNLLKWAALYSPAVNVIYSFAKQLMK